MALRQSKLVVNPPKEAEATPAYLRAAFTRIRDELNAGFGDIDDHETRISDHETRIATLEAAGGSSLDFTGNKMLFNLSTAPTDWVRDTSQQNGSALRYTTGVPGSGGAVDISSGLSHGSTGASNVTLPAHTHTFTTSSGGSHDHTAQGVERTGGAGSEAFYFYATSAATGTVVTAHTNHILAAGSHSHSGTTANAGSGSGSHSHSGPGAHSAFYYIDIIIATRN